MSLNREPTPTPQPRPTNSSQQATATSATNPAKPTKARLTNDQKMALAKQRLASAKERISYLSRNQRREETRDKIIFGAAVLAACKTNKEILLSIKAHLKDEPAKKVMAKFGL